MGECEPYIMKCPKCGKKFEVIEIEQIPGCRDSCDMFCPHCGKTIRSSMEVDFVTTPIREEK